MNRRKPSSALGRPLAGIARRFHVAATALVLAMAGSATAAEIEGIPFPDEVVAGEKELPVFGLGLLRYRVLFRGYVGGLYVPAGTPPNETLADIPKALELYYFWDIDAQLLRDAADEILLRSHPPERIAALRDRLDRLNALYKDVRAGDRYRLTYVPGDGTTLSYNGVALGTIPGADFGRDYLGIWLGREPLSEAFRDQLLKGR